MTESLSEYGVEALICEARLVSGTIHFWAALVTLAVDICRVHALLEIYYLQSFCEMCQVILAPLCYEVGQVRLRVVNS